MRCQLSRRVSRDVKDEGEMGVYCGNCTDSREGVVVEFFFKKSALRVCS